MKFKNYSELKENRPQLIKRLINWGLERKIGRFISPKTIKVMTPVVEEEIQEYLENLVFSPTSYSEALVYLHRWDSILTDKERQAVGVLFPWEFPCEVNNTRNKIGKLLNLGNYISSWLDLEKAENRKANLMNNWYDGAYKVLNEEVIDKIFYKSEDVGLVTMNSYGALVLNADDMLIIDIDNSIENCDSPVLYPEQAIACLRILQENRGGSYRVYQTAGGIRAIETTKPYDPSSWQVKRMMKSVMADPLYIALCQNQETFRARLTPKPWRHLELAPHDYEHEEGKEWVNSDSEVGVCRLLEVIGENKVDSRFSELINYHDSVTKALIPRLTLV